MVDATIHRELLTELGRLPPELQRRVLDFARTLGDPQPQRGVPGSSLLSLAGSLPTADALELSRLIEAGCERVDPGEW